jgi:outer membrane protein assembly factor BamB
MASWRRCALWALVLAASLPALAGCGSKSGRSDWPLPNLDLSSTRSVPSSPIDAKTAPTLHRVWRFRFRIAPTEDGAFTATPVVVGGTVYLEDMKSNVFALDLETGAIRWRRLFDATNPGPNGVAVVDGVVYGASDSYAFALSAKNGAILWRRLLVTDTQRFVDIAPQVANGLVYVSTIGSPPNGRGTLYALDARTGVVRWQLDTIKGRWSVPALAGGGGAWYTPSVADGRAYWGIANPLPWGGSKRYPNGGMYAGNALYTDSLLVTDASTGKLLWYDQVTPHDVRDYDFQLPPIIGSIGGKDVVFGAGKAGIVIAWDRSTHRRLWETRVGLRLNDVGPLPPRLVTVCPGLYGGVLTPMAYAGGTLFVPVVDLCMKGSSIGYENLASVNVAARGTGELVALDAATGRRLWTKRLPQPDFGCATAADGVVFTATFEGAVYALDAGSGATLWRGAMPAGVNACPSIAGNTLLVGAGVPKGRGTLELVAFRTG